jgi:hypothetical protein
LRAATIIKNLNRNPTSLEIKRANHIHRIRKPKSEIQNLPFYGRKEPLPLRPMRILIKKSR